MSYQLLPLSKEDEWKWERYVRDHRAATVFHSLEWKQLLETTFGFEPKYVLAEDSDGSVVSIFPAFSVKTFFGRRSLISQPFSSYGGPLYTPGHEACIPTVLRYYKRLMQHEKLHHFEIRTVNDENEPFYKQAGFYEEFKSYIYFINVGGLDFDKDIWHGLYTKKSGARRGVKTALSAGVQVREDRSVDVYYRLYLMTMERLAAAPVARAFFENAEKYLKSSVRFTFAYLEDAAIAACMSFLYNKRYHMEAAVSDARGRQYRANYLLYNEAIEYATRNQFDIIDFGRTEPNSSYEQFKKRWGAVKTNYYSNVFPASGRGRGGSSKRYLLYSKVKKKIPWVFTRTGLGAYMTKRQP